MFRPARAAPGTARDRPRDLIRPFALGLLGIGVLLAAWTIAARRLANPILLPVPRELVGGFLETWTSPIFLRTR